MKASLRIRRTHHRKTDTYKISGREAAAADLLRDYGADHIELALFFKQCLSGLRMAGPWNTLANRKAQGPSAMQIIYNAQGVFEGYAYVTRTLETERCQRHAAGAEMALYDAVEIFRNPEATRTGNTMGKMIVHRRNCCPRLRFQ